MNRAEIEVELKMPYEELSSYLMENTGVRFTTIFTLQNANQRTKKLPVQVKDCIVIT